MQCPYCGYEYNDRELKCPFCGTENTEEARSRQRKTIWSLEEESRDIRTNLPKQLKKQTDQKAGKAGATLLGTLAAVLVIVVAINLAARLFMDYADKQNTKQLESYLQAEDYDSLTALMDKIGAIGTTYDKYTEVVGVYRDITSANNELGWYYQGEAEGYNTQEIQLQYLSFAISDCVNATAEARYYINDQLMMENEEVLEDLESQAHHILTFVLLLEDEELNDAYVQAEYYYSPNAAMELAGLSYERMHENE